MFLSPHVHRHMLCLFIILCSCRMLTKEPRRYPNNSERVWYFVCLFCPKYCWKGLLTSHHKGKKSVQKRSSTDTFFMMSNIGLFCFIFIKCKWRGERGKKVCIHKEKKETLSLDVLSMKFSYFNICLAEMTFTFWSLSSNFSRNSAGHLVHFVFTHTLI